MNKQIPTIPLFQAATVDSNKANPFKTIPEQLKIRLDQHLKTINRLVAETPTFTWENLMQPLEELDNALDQFWSPFSHLHAVCNSPDTRACYDECLPLLSAFENAIGHHEGLFNAIKSIDIKPLSSTQQKIIHDHLRDFRLSGITLSPDKKKRFEAISTQLAKLSNKFQEHILDATQAFELHVTDEQRLSGLPEHAIHHAKSLAEEQKQPGWIFNLDTPCYLAVVTYADDRELRQALHEAYTTRASDQGPSAGRFDNTPVMNEILTLRGEKAKLLGFPDYAHLSLATKMAQSPTQVLSFLQDLIQRSHAQAEAEFNALQKFAQEQGCNHPLEPWDIAYWSEKKQHASFNISQEMLRPYFPLPRVMQGLFDILQKLYGMHMTAVKGIDTWHPDVDCYSISDNNGIRGYLFVDLFARTGKRDGAWMNSLQSRYKKANGEVQSPIATLTCNFTKPIGDKPATLSHDEVTTLFHELGHCLHHVLTQVDFLDASGIAGVEWDAVELPSQFFENWCWEKEAISSLSAHVETGEPLPDSLFESMLAAKNFHSAMAMVRQLEFSLFDFNLHQHYDPSQPNSISDILAKARKKARVVPVAPYDRFQHGFSHIFCGGYAAGYYSYKWAEVLSSDAFARFEEEGIFNAQTGRDFLHCILEVGGSCKAEEAYINFRGREATTDALLRHSGITR